MHAKSKREATCRARDQARPYAASPTTAKHGASPLLLHGLPAFGWVDGGVERAALRVREQGR